MLLLYIFILFFIFLTIMEIIFRLKKKKKNNRFISIYNEGKLNSETINTISSLVKWEREREKQVVTLYKLKSCT